MPAGSIGSWVWPAGRLGPVGRVMPGMLWVVAVCWRPGQAAEGAVCAVVPPGCCVTTGHAVALVYTELAEEHVLCRPVFVPPLLLIQGGTGEQVGRWTGLVLVMVLSVPQASVQCCLKDLLL